MGSDGEGVLGVGGSPTALICEYCREPLNPGATACKACGRSQPRPQGGSGGQTLFLGGAAVAVVLAIVYVVWLEYSDDAMADRISACARLHGQLSVTPDYVRFVVENQRQAGVSQDVAERALLVQYGCPD